MADEIKLPGGLHVKKEVAIGGGILLTAVVIYFYRKNKAQQAAAAAAAQTAANTTTAGQTGTTIDPQTGYPYGSPEDQAALAAMSYGQLPTYGSGPGGNYGPYYNPPGPGGGGGFTTNAQWAQAAEQLMGSNGADATAAALGKYLTGQPVTSDQQTLIQEAIAVEGYPPVAGPNGFPPSINLTAGGPPPPGGGSIAGLKVTSRFTNVSATWTPNSGDTSWTVTLTTHQGSQTVGSQTVSTPSVYFGGLQEKTGYAVHVTGTPSGATGVGYTTTQ